MGDGLKYRYEQQGSDPEIKHEVPFEPGGRIRSGSRDLRRNFLNMSLHCKRKQGQRHDHGKYAGDKCFQYDVERGHMSADPQHDMVVTSPIGLKALPLLAAMITMPA